jgi:hypothetical protein
MVLSVWAGALGQVEGDRLVFVRYEAEGGENRGGVVIAFCCGLQLLEYLAHSLQERIG